MSEPKRIQRKRTKGWTMPPNTVSVTRPGKWGNPFDFSSPECCWLALSYDCRGDKRGRQEASVKAFREWIEPLPKGKKLARMERGVSFGNDKKSVQVGPRFIVGTAAINRRHPHRTARQEPRLLLCTRSALPRGRFARNRQPPPGQSGEQ